MRSASLTRLQSGQDVFLAGDAVEGIALLVSGVVRVYLVGRTGREITLYRFGRGESCILSANAILNQEAFPAIATVEQASEAVIIPAESLREWVGRFELWRTFIFDLLSQRLLSVISILDEVAFGRLDARLATFLLERSQVQNPVQITHQEIASELGSSREVVSRLLEDFAGQGLIQVSRGQVSISDPLNLEKRTFM